MGKRNGEILKEVVADFAERTGGDPPALITTDDCNTYADVLLEQYGEKVVPAKPGRPHKRWPKGSAYATVKKTYGQGMVKAVRRELVHGTKRDLARALAASPCSATINTAFVERQNGTDRNHNARKARRTCEFSKDLLLHVAVTWWVMFCYNFNLPHRGLRLRRDDGTYLHRTPAMALGLEQRPMRIAEILTTQAVGFTLSARPSVAHFRQRPRHGAAP